MIWGGLESPGYAIDTGERRRGLWRPYMWPVKALMVLLLLSVQRMFGMIGVVALASALWLWGDRGARTSGLRKRSSGWGGSPS